MSIAEKLQTVAENIPKVYNAGYEKGKSEGGGTDLLQYATFFNGSAFRNAVFPDDVAENIYFKIKGHNGTFTVGFTYGFMGSNVKNITFEIEEIPVNGITFNSVFQACTDLISVTFTNDIFYISNGASAFNGATKLERINGVMDLSLANNVSGMFQKCYALTDIRFNEKSIKKSITFTDSANLSDESTTSIINGLADLTGQTAQILTLHADVKAKLTPDQIAQITNKNWTLA